jgi:hypothetical protein
MLDELYDDVLSIMTEKGFITWFENNQRTKTSPLKWCYDNDCELKAPPKPPAGLSWLGHTYDSYHHYPHTVIISDEGNVGPYTDVR